MPLLQKLPNCGMYFSGARWNSALFVSLAKRYVTPLCSSLIAGSPRTALFCVK